MKKYIRKWVKDEKRLIKLFYQKGLIDMSIHDLYWNEYRQGKRGRKRGGKKFAFNDYMPELHYCSRDYWGECDEHAVIPRIIEGMRFDKLTEEPDYEKNGGWGVSYFDGKSRAWWIKYLKSQPTVNRSSAINKVLIRRADY